MVEMRHICLSDVIIFKNGKKKPDDAGDIPIYGGNGILGYTNQSNYNNCIVIGRVGSYCGSVYYEPEECWVSDNAIAAIPISDMDVYYSYYLLRSLNLNNRHIGTGQPLLTQEILNKIECRIPALNIQKKIAAIFKVIDKKVSANSEINRNLEEQLDTMYLERYSANTNGILGDICEYSKEKIDVVKLSLETYYSTENMLPDKMGAEKASALPATEKVSKCNAGNVIISNIRPYFKKIVYCKREAGCSPDVLCFTTKQNGMSEYMYSTLHTDKFFAYMVTGSKGTKMPRGDKQQILKYPIYVPKADEIKDFSQMARNALCLIENNRKENERLAGIRDTLLPKLMSGELDVSNIDI